MADEGLEEVLGLEGYPCYTLPAAPMDIGDGRQAGLLGLLTDLVTKPLGRPTNAADRVPPHFGKLPLKV